MDTFNSDFCAPNKKDSKNTCFSYPSLVKIAKAWNQDLQDGKIEGNPINSKLLKAKDTDTNKEKLWKQISSRLIDKAPCQNDYCLVDYQLVKNLEDDEIKYETFRPKKPTSWYKNKFAWLSTTDIQYVLLQYESLYPDFEFIGPVPIDFDKKISVGGCIVDELCRLDLEALYRQKKRKIGIVFNLDPHDMPGSHWVSMFVNMDNGGIYFFDSVGKFPGDEISNLMFRIREQGNKLLKNGVIDFDEFQDTHQIVKGVQSAGHGQYKILTKSAIPKFLIDMSAKLLDDNNFNGGSTQIFTIKDVNLDKIKIDLSDNQMDGEGRVNYNNILVKGFRLFYNDIEHQQKNTECGVYSIHFIESLLNGISFRDYTKNIIRDNTMNKNRERLYRPSKLV